VRGGKARGDDREPHRGFTGWFDSEVRPTTVKGERRRLALEDKWLRTERNDEECSKLLWGRMGWCVAPFMGLGR
jgi:hypothetical protein